MRTMRTCARFAAVSALALAWLPVGSSVQADSVRTDTQLAGFFVGVEATALRILLDDPKLELPRPTGSAVLEADPNYTLASVSAGPNAHAITSTLWPGNLLGAGLAQIAPGVPAYPLKGEARYPDSPYDASSPEGGSLSSAHAEGLLAKAVADATPKDKPGTVAVGGARATSTATVDGKDVAVGTAFSSVQDVSLVSGIVHIDSVTTTLTTKADGTTPTSSGTTTVEGLTIAGQAFTVDDKGLHAADNGSALPPLVTPETLTSALGISAQAIKQSTTKSNNGISRVAGGLVIKLDTGPLRAALSPVAPTVNPILNGIISRLPAEAQGNLYYLVKATPTVTFIFGSANASSAATLPISFSFPPPSFPGGGALGPVGAPGGGTGGTAPIAPLAPTGTTGVPPIVPPAAPQPVTQDPGTTATASTSPAATSGIGAGPVVGSLLLSGLIGWGLLRFLGLAGGALPFGCRLGAPTSVPNLRSVTA